MATSLYIQIFSRTGTTSRKTHGLLNKLSAWISKGIDSLGQTAWGGLSVLSIDITEWVTKVIFKSNILVAVRSAQVCILKNIFVKKKKKKDNLNGQIWETAQPWDESAPNIKPFLHHLPVLHAQVHHNLEYNLARKEENTQILESLTN